MSKMSNFKLLRKFELAERQYENAKSICISLGAKESDFLQTDAKMQEIKKILKKRASGGIVGSGIKIFEIIGGDIHDTDKRGGYHNCDIVSINHIEGRYHAIVLPHGGEHEFEFKISSPENYDRILQAYMNNETIGVILR